MGTIEVVNHISLDGVMQAPGGADEDPAGASHTAAGPSRMPTKSWRRDDEGRA